VQIEGERSFDAPPAQVFAALMSPDVLTGAVPGVREPRVVDETHWTAKVKAPIPFAPALTLRFEVVDRRPPRHASLRVDGGGAHVVSNFDLEPEGVAATRMRWITTVELSGLLSPFAGPGLEPIARRQAERALDRVAARLYRSASA